MRLVEDVRASLNQAPDALSTKRYLLELVEVILYRLHLQSELGAWELDHLAKAIVYLRMNIGSADTHFSTSWLSAAEVSIVKSLVPHDKLDDDNEAHASQLKHVSYEQLMGEIQSLRDLLPSDR
ncbi:MAG TPA: hypothetical protein VN066_03580 [Rhodocyclaceae bacterium]|jgi:hypothetical protein|nr:hypothetical protein [Rhodocyclaceae bacterium]